MVTALEATKIVALFIALGAASYAWIWLAGQIRTEIKETMK